MESPLAPFNANTFLSHHEKKQINSCPRGFTPFFTDVMSTKFLFFLHKDFLMQRHDSSMFLNENTVHTSASSDSEHNF